MPDRRCTLCIADIIPCQLTTEINADNDAKRLKKLTETEFSDIINYMLENNCKLEQETMDS